MQKLPFSISTLTEKSTNYTYLIPKYFPNIPHDFLRNRIDFAQLLDYLSLEESCEVCDEELQCP